MIKEVLVKELDLHVMLSWKTGYVAIGIQPFDWRLDYFEDEGECIFCFGPMRFMAF